VTFGGPELQVRSHESEIQEVDDAVSIEISCRIGCKKRGFQFIHVQEIYDVVAVEIGG
jgi:hypothetical protein